MAKSKESFLRHISELISQNKSLMSENEKLASQNEQLTQEVEKYKHMLAQAKNEKLQGLISVPKTTNIIKYKTATVLFADTQGFNDISADMTRRSWWIILMRYFCSWRLLLTNMR